MTVLHVRGVTAGYGRRVALRECTIGVRPGELAAVVGPNGAGKSTLLRVLAAVLRPFSGTVTLDGSDLASFPRSALARRIAVVPQIFDTLFPFTVREIVALGRTARLGAFGAPRREDVAAVDRAIADLELGTLAARRIDQLSGGERQRAVLAMALAQEADVLLLDEPTVHLDPSHQLATLAWLGRLARDRGLAVVAVLHDLNLAAARADRIVVIDDGRVMRDGPPDRVLDQDLVSGVFGPGLAVTRIDGALAVLPARV